MINTSQDPEYVGPTGHEKKFHKTHFQGVKKFWKSGESPNEWVKVGNGIYKLLPKKRENADDESEVE